MILKKTYSHIQSILRFDGLNLTFLNFAKIVATKALSCYYSIKIQNG